MSDDFLIQHVNVNVDDMDAAIPFYRDVLGLSLDDTPRVSAVSSSESARPRNRSI